MRIITDNCKTESANAFSLLSLLHLSSPALPVGSFAYSQGLEYAMDAGWCKTPGDIERWIADNLRFGFGRLDLPVYMRLYRAWRTKNVEDIQYWNETLLAFRETRELFEEDVTVGSAYVRWHLGQDAERENDIALCPNPTVASMHALAAVYSGINCESAMLGFAWAWTENQVACASKALPMGQTDGQRILQTMMPVMVQVCDSANSITDDGIGSGLMGVALASASHEQQYSRMFRS